MQIYNSSSWVLNWKTEIKKETGKKIIPKYRSIDIKTKWARSTNNAPESKYGIKTFHKISLHPSNLWKTATKIFQDYPNQKFV